MPFRRFFNKFFLAALVICAFSVQNSLLASAEAEGEHPEEHTEGGEFSVKETIFHHLLDAYEWEFFKLEDGTAVSLSLPRILWNPEAGSLDIFGSTESAMEAGYIDAHKYDHNALHGQLLVPGTDEKVAALNPASPDYEEEVHHIAAASKPWDFSITKNVLLMFIVAALMLFIFIGVANAYKKRPDSAPRGSQNLFETIIVFVRDEIAVPNIPHKYHRFMPLLLTMFFFIWLLNLLGMVPFSGNVTGNISVTLALALVTLAATIIFANKAYWAHIFWPPVPHGVKPIMVPLEFLSIFTKPFALTIRLFANITGGHVIVISLISLIFIFGKMGQEPALGFGVGIFSTLFVVAIGLLELFVAALQAYVFTLLTAVFIGQAVEEAEHH